MPASSVYRINTTRASNALGLDGRRSSERAEVHRGKPVPGPVVLSDVRSVWRWCPLGSRGRSEPRAKQADVGRRAARPVAEVREDCGARRCGHPVLSDAPLARSVPPPSRNGARDDHRPGNRWRRPTFTALLCCLALVPTSTRERMTGLQRPVNEERLDLGAVATVRVPGARVGPGREVAPLRVDQFEVTNEQYALWMNRERHRLKLVHSDRLGALEVHHERWGRIAAVKPHGRTSFGAMGVQVEERSLMASAEHGTLWFSPVEEEEALPVRYVSWRGANAYCHATGRRLPTAAEWEHLAGVNRLESAWRTALVGRACDALVAGRHRGGECEALDWRPQRVGSAPLDRSPEGVADVAGNLAEWTSSRVERAAARCQRDDDALQASCRVVKGGDYATPLSRVRLKARPGAAEDLLAPRIGFRCVEE